MFSVRSLVIPIILTIGILFTAGCTGPPYTGHTGIDPIENISPVSFPQQEAGRIRIDPNLRFLKNEEITLTGTTSLPQDEEIRIHITPPGTGYRGNASTTIPDILAVRGPGNSTWSATVNPLLITSVSTHLYPVTAYAENHPDIRASSNFSVSDTYPLVVGAPYIFSGNVLPGNITAVQVWMLNLLRYIPGFPGVIRLRNLSSGNHILCMDLPLIINNFPFGHQIVLSAYNFQKEHLLHN